MGLSYSEQFVNDFELLFTSLDGRPYHGIRSETKMSPSEQQRASAVQGVAWLKSAFTIRWLIRKSSNT